MKIVDRKANPLPYAKRRKPLRLKTGVSLLQLRRTAAGLPLHFA